MVDNNIVDGAVANDLPDILEERHEEIDLYRINQAHFPVVDEVGVIADTVGEGPQALKQILIAVVDTDVVNVRSDSFHYYDRVYKVLKKEL